MAIAAVAGWTAWWISLSPRGDKDWIDENRHQATGRIDGDRLEISNLRNFEWRGKRDWVERWESRSCDLSALRGVDMFLCTWGDPRIAHVMLSFDFEGGEPICFSVETRRERGERWTPYGGFMKAFELIVICGDERDLVGLRVRRKETVRFYRVYTTPDMRRRCTQLGADRVFDPSADLDELLADCADLAEQPRTHGAPRCWRRPAPSYWISPFFSA